MKQSILPLVALIMAVTFSSFRLPSAGKPLTTLYWFEVNPTKGSEVSFDNSEVSYIQASATPPTGLCSGTKLFKCVVGFDASQMDIANDRLQPGNHTPAQVGDLRVNN